MNLKKHIKAIEQQGFSVLPDLLSNEQIDAVKQALRPWLQKQHMGRNDFEGYRRELAALKLGAHTLSNESSRRPGSRSLSKTPVGSIGVEARRWQGA